MKSYGVLGVEAKNYGNNAIVLKKIGGKENEVHE